MSRDDLIELEGTVIGATKGIYRVECDGGHIVTAKLKKRLKRFRIRVVLGDRVKVGVSPYDAERGLITYRER